MKEEAFLALLFLDIQQLKHLIYFRHSMDNFCRMIEWPLMSMTKKIFLLPSESSSSQKNVNITKNKYKILVSDLQGPIIQMKIHMIEWSTKNGE